MLLDLRIAQAVHGTYIYVLFSLTTVVIIFFLIVRFKIPRNTKNINFAKTLSNGSEKYKKYENSKKHLLKTLSNEADPYC